MKKKMCLISRCGEARGCSSNSCDTVRYKHSAIPDMTKHLNKKHEDNLLIINKMK